MLMIRNKTLRDWEEELRQKLAGVDLLSEAGPISGEETCELGKLIGAHFTNADWEHVKVTIARDYPCSFAVYLVFQGIHGYEEGDFWSGVRETTGIDLSPAKTSEWGQLFERIEERFGVARFPLLGGHRYVGPILAHGGVPDSSLADFFDRFIHPWVTNAEYTLLTANEFIEERLYHSNVQKEVDKPIIRFLKYGGRVAEDFVDRCRNMAMLTVQTGEVPLPEEVGLYSQVTDRYRQWCTGKDLRVDEKRFRGIRKPILIMEPWGLGPSLYFPPQNALLDKSEWQATWRVYADTKLLEEWNHDAYTVEESNVGLRQVAQEYKVELAIITTNHGQQEDTAEFQRIWRYPGMMKDCPVMFFDASTKKQIPSRTVLPAVPVWVYRRPDIELKARPPPTLRVMEELPQLPSGWSTLLGQLIDLTDVEELTVREGGANESQFAIYKEDQHLLERGERFPTYDGGPPLYIGTPPNLNIPLHGTFLNKWHVQIHNEGPSSPDINIHLTLEDLDRQGHLSHGRESVMLRLDRYLSLSPLGNYRVTLRGALGHKVDLRFRILPFLEMVGHDTLHLPDEGQPEVQFLLETLAHVEVSLQAGARDCAVTLVDDGDARSMYEITVGENISNVPLRFSSRKSNEKTALVPVLVPIRRLRWIIILSQEETFAPKWQTTPLHLPLETIEQSQEPCLLVDLFGGTCDNLEVTVLLVDDDEAILQKEHLVLKKGQSPARFDLRAFLDTIRHSPSQVSLKLCMRGLPATSDGVTVPVVFITRGFHAEGLDIKSTWERNAVSLSLRWYPTTTPLRHRFIRFWPAWRPWEKPLTVPIPDGAQGHYESSLPRGDLKPGKYLLEFGVRNPWLTEQLPMMPRANDTTTISVLIPQGAAKMRLEGLVNLGNRGGLPFAAMLERACIRQDLGQEEMARADFQWCVENLDTAAVGPVPALARCVSSEPALFTAVRRKMAEAHRVAQAVDEYQARQLDEDTYREYLQLLPRDGLLPSDTCEVLLKVDDEQLRLHAAQQLLQSGNSSGAQAVVEWVKKNALLDGKALELLKHNIPLAAEALRRSLPDVTAIRLLEKLGKEYPHIVLAVTIRTGCWVRCAAGWGRIERIEGLEREEVLQFPYTERKYRLHVLLRAQDPETAEQVLLDLDKQTVTFVRAAAIYTCSECRHFSTRHNGLITSAHGHAAHKGKTPGLYIDRDVTLLQNFELEFLPAQPENPWV